MYGLVFTPAADGALTKLEVDPILVTTAHHVQEALDSIAADPTAARVNRRHYRVNQGDGLLRGVLLYSHDETWLVLWQLSPTANEIIVHYIGPDI